MTKKNIGSAKQTVQCTNTHKCVDIADIRIIESALIKDSSICSDRSRFITNNKPLYRVAINSWIGLLQSLSNRTQPEILAMIGTKGLIPVVKEACMLSDAIVRDQPLPNSCFSYFLRDIAKVDEIEGKRIALFGLRYLKRLSPSDTDTLETLGLSALYNSNNHCKMWSRKNDTYYLDLLRQVVRLLFRTNIKMETDIAKALLIPSGAVYKTQNKTLAQKLLELEKYYPMLLGNIIGTYSGPLQFRNYATRVTTVPKSYKAVRVIAIEEEAAQIEQQLFVSNFFSNLCSRVYPVKNMDVTDQERNREFARLGSIDGSLATLDLSSASDTVSHSLVMAVLPRELALEYDRVRSKSFVIQGKTTMSSIASTMGSRITFPIETMIFFSIALLSVELYSALTGIPSTVKSELIKQCSSFGDDIIVPTCAAELCLQLLDHFGFFPNTDKSFFNATECYRESCGEEYLFGTNISTKYFPRRPFPTQKTDRINFLIALQHKLVDYRDVNTFLIGEIRSLEPKMTESFIGSTYQDIWSYYPQETNVHLRGWTISNRRLVAHEITDNAGNLRAKHFVPISQYKPVLTKESEDAYQRYAYYTFLRQGPYYPDPLSELLRVTERRITRDAFLGTSMQVPGYIID